MYFNWQTHYYGPCTVLVKNKNGDEVYIAQAMLIRSWISSVVNPEISVQFCFVSVSSLIRSILHSSSLGTGKYFKFLKSVLSISEIWFLLHKIMIFLKFLPVLEPQSFDQMEKRNFNVLFGLLLT